MKLFVDDWRPAPQGWWVARTVTEAIRVLSENVFEVVALDHDIEGHCYYEKMMQAPCQYNCQDANGFKAETFFAVARYIALMHKDDMPKRIYIHTANTYQGQLMGTLLERRTEIIHVDHNNNDLILKLNFHEDEREGKHDEGKHGV